MKITPVLIALAFLPAAVVLAEEDTAITEAMKYAHKAPKGQKKLNEKIVEGTATEDEVKKTLELYKKMVDVKPPKGETDAWKKKCAVLIVATQEVVDKKEGAAAHYKEAVNCKSCHQEFKAD